MIGSFLIRVDKASWWRPCIRGSLYVLPPSHSHSVPPTHSLVPQASGSSLPWLCYAASAWSALAPSCFWNSLTFQTPLRHDLSCEAFLISSPIPYPRVEFITTLSKLFWSLAVLLVALLSWWTLSGEKSVSCRACELSGEYSHLSPPWLLSRWQCLPCVDTTIPVEWMTLGSIWFCPYLIGPNYFLFNTFMAL